ncbi:tape measure protein, partial [Faecalibaculum rodentium]|uniref:tape measure protein n=1 Tax=Faecalibaculum rodentium TaxID=1702221 RepID=UPI0025B76EF6
MSSHKVEAILSAKDNGLTDVLKRVESTLKSLDATVKQIGSIMLKAKDAGATTTINKVERAAESLDKTKAETELAADDRASPIVEKVTEALKKADSQKAEATLSAKDKASPAAKQARAAINQIKALNATAKLDAKDKATAKIRRVMSSLKQVASHPGNIIINAKDKASQLISEAGRKVKALAAAKAAPTIDAKDGPFNQKVQGVKEKLSALSNAAGTVAFGFLQSAGQKAFSALGSSIDGAISRYDTLQQFPKVMSQMGYSAAQAQANIQKMSDGIDGLPTTLDGIVANAKNLTLTLGDMDKGTDTAIAFNNAMLASGASTEDADRALTQYTQMLANGKPDMQSWMSMQTAGKYALTEVAKELGIASGSTQELYDQMQKGNISLDQFNDALIKVAGSGSKMAETARKSIEGIGTSLKNLANAGKKGMANLLTTIDEGLAASGTSIAGMIDSLKGLINTGFKGAQTAAAQMIAQITSMGSGAFEPIMTGAKKLGDGLSKAFQSFLSGALPQITQQLANLANLVGKVAGAFGDMVGSIDMSFLAGVLSGVTAKFRALLEIVGQVMQKMADTGVANKVATAFGKIGQVVNDMFMTMSRSGAMDKLLDLFVQLVGVLADAASAVADFISGIDGDILGNVVTGVVGAIAAFKGLNFLQGFNPIQSFLNKFKSGTKETFNTSSKLAQSLKAVFDGIAKVIKTAGTAIADAAKGIGKGLETAFKGIASASKMANPVGLLALSAVILAIGAALALVASQGQGVAAIIAGIGTAFANAAPFVTALGDAIGVIVEAIGTALALVASQGQGVAAIIAG